MKHLHSGPQADDAVQDAIERAWRARGTFIEGAALKPWILRILRNAITDRYRLDKCLVQDVDGLEASRLISEPDQLWRLQYAEVVTVIETLSATQRRALLLVALGLTYVEAAAAMACPIGTFKSYVRLARQKLTAAGV
jgi:RNA polymerase sigma-70 factor (ECF subfamily)